MDPQKWALAILLLISFSCSLHAQSFHSQYVNNPTANLSTVWKNDNSTIKINDDKYSRGYLVRPILTRRRSVDPFFACGFFCNGTCDSFVFGIFFVQSYPGDELLYSPQVVWSANRNNPVKENATLGLNEDGDLVLRDVNGTKVWSTNTSGKYVVGINLLETGNLVLFNKNNSIIWQSFDHPTDSLLLGQKLVQGQRLTASVSAENSAQGLFYLSMNTNGLFAFVQVNPPQIYYRYVISGIIEESTQPSYVRFMNGSLEVFISLYAPSLPVFTFSVPLASSVQYTRLDYDGHLRVYQFDSELNEWKVVKDVFEGFDECYYPTVCGNYGICSGGQCSCPKGTDGDYFRELIHLQPKLGCSAITPLSCQTPQYHRLLYLANISYFGGFEEDDAAFLKGTDVKTCKDACLRNCSCKASLMRFYDGNISYGDCYLPSQLFSLIDHNVEQTNFLSSAAFIKVQIPPRIKVQIPPRARKKTSRKAATLGSILGALFGACLVVGTCILLLRKKNAEEEEDCFDQVPGMPVRFSYENLKAATSNFFNKLGEGGFGSVFEGTLGDGTKVAVKRLDGVGQGKREFLAEVETIGSIHHVNLVRLIGLCAEKSHRLLVYEYMCNGSLDRWIFCRKYQKPALEWQKRREIITGIAKGLAYLHEECRQRIAHLDIKPQNILLDENLNVKISDFGLAKMIDRDQSQVMTRMRGTPGYLAPEWLTSIITEKVDVYSFGIVVLEIVCGRKNLDSCQSEENKHLLSLLKRKAEEDRLLDLVDKHIKDTQFHGEEIMKSIKIAVWCLQGDITRRPSMSVVVKVLDGVMDVEPDFLDYSFSTSTPTKDAGLGVSAPPMASVLSAPR